MRALFQRYGHTFDPRVDFTVIDNSGPPGSAQVTAGGIDLLNREGYKICQ